MKTTHRVIMLPALDKDSYSREHSRLPLRVYRRGQLLLNVKEDELIQVNNGHWNIAREADTCKPQHLYIISSEKFKEGDWVYDHAMGRVGQFDGLKSDSGSFSDHCWKIISTTDISTMKGELCFAPIILSGNNSEVVSFIEKYNTKFSENFESIINKINKELKDE